MLTSWDDFPMVSLEWGCTHQTLNSNVQPTNTKAIFESRVKEKLFLKEDKSFTDPIITGQVPIPKSNMNNNPSVAEGKIKQAESAK